MNDPVTVRDAASKLGLSVRAVQTDVRAGCGGIVRPGGPGRGNGTLLDMGEYRRWRASRAGAVEFNAEQERARAWELMAEGALRTFQEHAGVTRENRRRAIEILCLFLERVGPVLLGREVKELPEQMRTLLRVYAELSNRINRGDRFD